MQLMLHPGRPASFRRTVKQEDGPAIVYTFESRDPVEIPEHDLPRLFDDIGTALVVPKAGTAKPDFEATRDLIEMLQSDEKPKKKKK